MDVPISHVALHLALCGAIAKKSAETPVAIHVRLIDRDNHNQVDKTFNLTRGYDAQRVVEFDAERGVYHLIVEVPKYNCSANNYVAFIPDVDRNSISETLVPGVATDNHPMMIIGKTPQEFAGEEPTFVFFEKATTGCNKPVGDPIPGDVRIDYDQQAYYASLYSDPSFEAHGPMYMALRLRTPQKEYHYLRIPEAFPIPWRGWPVTVHFDLPQYEFLSVSKDPIDTLLCPKWTKTSVG